MLTSFWKNCWPIIITWQQKNKKITNAGVLKNSAIPHQHYKQNNQND